MGRSPCVNELLRGVALVRARVTIGEAPLWILGPTCSGHFCRSVPRGHRFAVYSLPQHTWATLAHAGVDGRLNCLRVGARVKSAAMVILVLGWTDGPLPLHVKVMVTFLSFCSC